MRWRTVTAGYRDIWHQIRTGHSIEIIIICIIFKFNGGSIDIFSSGHQDRPIFPVRRHPFDRIWDAGRAATPCRGCWNYSHLWTEIITPLDIGHRLGRWIIKRASESVFGFRYGVRASFLQRSTSLVTGCRAFQGRDRNLCG